MIPASLLFCNDVTVVEAEPEAGVESQRAKVFRPGRLVGGLLTIVLGIGIGLGPTIREKGSEGVSA